MRMGYPVYLPCPQRGKRAGRKGVASSSASVVDCKANSGTNSRGGAAMQAAPYYEEVSVQPAPGRRRVVVTGLGAITSIGLSAGAFWESLIAGRSGIGPITFFDSSIYPCKLAGEIHDFEPGNYMDRKDAR